MPHKTRDIFQKDPLQWQLVNEGVSSNNTTDVATLRYELQTFVCEGEYRTGLVRILEGYVANFNAPEQKAAWVSGFYGSGKSHLVKVLRYLWTDFRFADGNTARNLAHLPEDVVALFKELSTLGKKHQGLHSAGGTLKRGVGSVRLRLLSIIFASLDLPEEYPYAKFLLHLRRDGRLDEFRKTIEAGGKSLKEELRRMYSSPVIAKAYLNLYPNLGDVTKVGPALRADFADVKDIGIPEMLDVIRLALGNGGRLPCTLIVLDEIQQFISDRPELAHDIQEVTEACSKELGSRIMFVGTGQSALSDSVQALQRLMGRYSIKVHLRDNDVERVVRTVVLQKKESAKPEIQALVSKQEGEITRQLKATRIGTLSEDHTSYIPDFPLLPVRRRFWERVLHSVDPTGTAAQMRTQLRVVHEACRTYADRPLGAVVPADFVYDQICTDLVQTGEMQKRFQEIIDEQAKKPDGDLRRRVCALVFLINKLPREAGVDIGVRAEAEHLADLMVDDLATGSTTLRQQLPAVLKKLVEDGVLMEIEGEYRLQTTEGAAWEAEFRKFRAQLLNDEAEVAAQRSQLFAGVLQTMFSGLSVKHGSANERRRIVLHIGSENPPTGLDGIVLWVRDGFAETDAAFLADVRKRSTDDPTLHMFVAKAHADELKQALVSWLAADQTLNFKGNPTTNEGQEARRAVLTRQGNERQKANDLVENIVRQSRLFLSGGQEQNVITLREAVEAAAEEVLARLYPKFAAADSPNWPIVLRKAKEGAANAIQAVGHAGDIQSHPVAIDVLKFIGAGKKGTEIVKQFTAPPYGWPKDAIDAILAALLVSNHLSARLQGAPLSAADADQRKLGQADYRIEQPVLSAQQKIALRKLFQTFKVPARPGDEVVSAGLFVSRALELARSAGGPPPAPEPPSIAGLLALQNKSGNELLQELYDRREDLSQDLADWMSYGLLIQDRMPAYERAEKLLSHAGSLPQAVDWCATLVAVCGNRSLVESPDPVAPVSRAICEALRAALSAAAAAYAAAHATGLAELTHHDSWAKIPPAKQDALLAEAGIEERTAPEVQTDADLLAALSRSSLSTWRAHTDALPAQFSKALSAAIKELEPKARRISLPPATVHNTAELDAWVQSARASIEEALRDGPVIL